MANKDSFGNFQPGMAPPNTVPQGLTCIYGKGAPTRTPDKYQIVYVDITDTAHYYVNVSGTWTKTNVVP